MDADAPILSCKEDKLDREQFAEHLATYLMNLDQDESAVVALCGKWGSGKTSLINMATEKLKEQRDHPIIVRFNPWNCIDTERLVPGFLSSLRESLAGSLVTEKASHTVQRVLQAIEKYSAVLAPIDIVMQLSGIPVLSSKAADSASKALQSFARADNDVESCKRKVSEALRYAFKSVIVIIDDIDRLPNDRICLLFQLVAQIADFSRVHYLLAYDADIVKDAISDLQGSGGDYLEKVVQLEIEVPLISKSAIYVRAMEFAYQYLRRRQISESGAEAQRVDEIVSSALLPCMKTMRGFKRFANAFEFEEQYIKDAVSCADLLGMVCLKLFYPELIPWIDSHTHELCGPATDSYTASNAAKNREAYQRTLEDITRSAGHDSSAAFEVLCILFPRFSSTCGRNAESLNDSQLKMMGRIASAEVFYNYRRGSLIQWAYPRDAIQKLIREGTREEVAEAFGQGAIDGFDLVTETSGLLDDVGSERAQVLASALLDVIAASAKTDEGNYRGDVYERMLGMLLKTVGTGKAAEMLLSMVSKSTIEGLVRVSHLINTEELAHGRVGDSEERVDRQVLKLSDLEALEDAYVRRINSLAERQNMLVLPGNQMLLSLWSRIDPETEAAYIERMSAENPMNVVRLCKLCISPWRSYGGSGAGTITSWSISWSACDRFLDMNAVQEQIDAARSEPEFWAAPDLEKQSAAALYLCVEREIPREADPLQYEVEQKDVLDSLSQWREEYERSSRSVGSTPKHRGQSWAIRGNGFVL